MTDKAKEWANGRIAKVVPPSDAGRDVIYFDPNTLTEELAQAFRAGQAYGESKSNRATVSHEPPITFSRGLS